MNGTPRELAIGLDLGTGGARAVALDLGGSLVASSRVSLPAGTAAVHGPQVEQDPHAWWQTAERALGELASQLPPNSSVVGLSVDATSGTFCLVDSKNVPITRGIMYNDLRAADIAPAIAAVMAPVLRPFGIEVGPSFALPKLVHLLRRDPRLRDRARLMVHQTDWLIAQLTGEWGVTDVSTALKAGADPAHLRWPDEIAQLDVPKEWLPRIVMPGTTVGRLIKSVAETTGLPQGIPIVAGCTDGTAASLASGASQPGDLNVSLGTTLVFKGVADQPLIDPQRTIYNHRHPTGAFLPGAASSTGAQWIETLFAGEDVEALTVQAEQEIPTEHIVYPLIASGERFPFSQPAARGFGWEQIADPATRFAACLEGTAFVERLGIERLRALDPDMGWRILPTGGGARNPLWLAMRASVNHRSYYVPVLPESAVGAAILAAVPVVRDCGQAIRQMVRIDRVIDPHPLWRVEYDDKYEEFLDQLRSRGWI